MSVKLITVTPEAEKLIAYCARVSSPNQENPEIDRLLSYCIRKGHWSIFEQAVMTVEIHTSRAISRQILRHRSFNFQEHSQRYAKTDDYVPIRARRQDNKNRQNSFDDLDDDTVVWFYRQQQKLWDAAQEVYQAALEKGIAKECARMVLPESAQSRLYMTGTIRSFIHYLQVRCGVETQKEHRDIAEQIKAIFIGQFPVIAKALDWA